MDKIDLLFDNGSVSSRPKQGFRFDKVAAKFCEYAKLKGRKHRRSFVINDAPVAQLDRASGYEPEGREFESPRARHFFRVQTRHIGDTLYRLHG